MWPSRIMAYFAYDTYKLPMNFSAVKAKSRATRKEELKGGREGGTEGGRELKVSATELYSGLCSVCLYSFLCSESDCHPLDLFC